VNTDFLFPLGELIHGKVEHQVSFRVLVDIGDERVRGIVQITDFVDSGDMTPDGDDMSKQNRIGM
jgi:DNA-directed RNA polymerase subunit E'/Rpb7